MSAPGPIAPREGWLAPEVELELPGLRLHWTEVVVGRPEPLTGDSPPDIESRLRELSSRVRGARAIGIRTEPVPSAYRVFFRQIGLDPDVERTPVEAAILERMLRGGFLTGGLLDDVLLIALMDTGVPVWALDSTTLDGPLGIRESREVEQLGRSGEQPLLAAGRLVVADSSAALAPLFGECAPGHRPSSETALLTLFALQVPGVPALYIEEALWNVTSALEGP
jgi:DNA/RNA-binding domain of Phe-tRNA-synthetase-like protein